MVVCNEKVADREVSNPLICLTGFMTFICKVLLYPKSELSTLKASTGMVCLENRGFIGLPTSNHCTGQEQQSYVMGKSNSHPESHSVERVQTSVHGAAGPFFPSFLH